MRTPPKSPLVERDSSGLAISTPKRCSPINRPPVNYKKQMARSGDDPGLKKTKVKKNSCFFRFGFGDPLLVVKIKSPASSPSKWVTIQQKIKQNPNTLPGGLLSPNKTHVISPRKGTKYKPQIQVETSSGLKLALQRVEKHYPEETATPPSTRTIRQLKTELSQIDENSKRSVGKGHVSIPNELQPGPSTVLPPPANAIKQANNVVITREQFLYWQRKSREESRNPSQKAVFGGVSGGEYARALGFEDTYSSCGGNSDWEINHGIAYSFGGIDGEEPQQIDNLFVATAACNTCMMLPEKLVGFLFAHFKLLPQVELSFTADLILKTHIAKTVEYQINWGQGHFLKFTIDALNRERPLLATYGYLIILNLAEDMPVNSARRRLFLENTDTKENDDPRDNTPMDIEESYDPLNPLKQVQQESPRLTV